MEAPGSPRIQKSLSLNVADEIDLNSDKASSGNQLAPPSTKSSKVKRKRPIIRADPNAIKADRNKMKAVAATMPIAGVNQIGTAKKPSAED